MSKYIIKLMFFKKTKTSYNLERIEYVLST
jgi:hypothetical protein